MSSFAGRSSHSGLLGLIAVSGPPLGAAGFTASFWIGREKPRRELLPANDDITRDHLSVTKCPEI
jgi:hypothetical protein